MKEDVMTTGMLEIHLTAPDAASALREDAAAGLAAVPKELSPKWFYDARGSALFERITELPEYFAARTEQALLQDSAAEIAALSGADTLVELGAGASTKTRVLLDALQHAGPLRRCVLQDVSASALRPAMDVLGAEYSRVQMRGVVSDFTSQLNRLPAHGHRMIAFLGGTVGNMRPYARREFLDQLRAVLRPGEQLLLGTGMVTDEETLVRAYDDVSGVTAEFNRNVLHVLNRELGADFDVSAFEHVARWNDLDEWIEMRLRASRAMTVHLTTPEMSVEFATGEELITEISAKFRVSGVRQMLQSSGFAPLRTWTDVRERCALTLAVAE